MFSFTVLAMLLIRIYPSLACVASFISFPFLFWSFILDSCILYLFISSVVFFPASDSSLPRQLRLVSDVSMNMEF